MKPKVAIAIRHAFAAIWLSKSSTEQCAKLVMVQVSEIRLPGQCEGHLPVSIIFRAVVVSVDTAW